MRWRETLLSVQNHEPVLRFHQAYHRPCDGVFLSSSSMSNVYVNSTRKLSRLETQMEALRNRVPETTTAVTLLELQHQVGQRSQIGNRSSPTYSHQFQQQPPIENDYTSPVSMSVSTHSHRSQRQPRNAFSQVQTFDQSPRTEYGLATLKRKRGDFELNTERSIDVVAKGLISLSDAQVYFAAFFQGCVSSPLRIMVKRDIRMSEDLMPPRINMFPSSTHDMTHLRT